MAKTTMTNDRYDTYVATIQEWPNETLVCLFRDLEDGMTHLMKQALEEVLKERLGLDGPEFELWVLLQ